MANYIESIAKMLGVEIGERFKLKKQIDSNVINYPFFFDKEEGLMAVGKNGTFRCQPVRLYEILLGDCKVVKLPTKYTLNINTEQKENKYAR